VDNDILMPAIFGLILGVVVFFVGRRAISKSDPVNATRNASIMGVLAGVGLFLVRYYHLF